MWRVPNRPNRLEISDRSMVTILVTLTLEATFNPVLLNSSSEGSRLNSPSYKLSTLWEEMKQTVTSLPVGSAQRMTAGRSLV